jgi:tetratricopeptide (TPR) repeat protein
MRALSAKRVLILLVPLLLILHVISNGRVQGIRNSIQYKDTLDAPLLPNTVMQMAAGEFKGLVADFLTMEIGAFIDSGINKSDDDWERVAFHFSQSMALDPYFGQTYRLVQAFLPMSGRVEEANALLEIARKHLPWDWYPPFFMSFNYFNELKDYNKASQYLIEASKVEGAPPILATLGARLAQKSGQTQTALAFLKTMHRNPDYDEDAKSLIAARIMVLEGVLILERAIALYEQRNGRSIETLDDLVTSGILNKLPVHGESGQYGYADGRITY